MEKAQKFKFLTNFSYMDKTFKVFINENYQKYFLRVLEDGSLLYPNLDEFRELYKIFSAKDVIVKKHRNEENNSKKDSEEVRNSGKFGAIFSMVPKVINKKTLISFITALVMIGNTSELTLAQVAEALDTVELQEYEEELAHYQKSSQFEHIYKQTVSEYAEKLGIKQNPTLEDMYERIDGNNRLTDEQKTWLKNGIANIKKNEAFKEWNGAILWYNLGREFVEIVSDDQINEGVQNAVPPSGVFYQNTAKVELNKKIMEADNDIEKNVTGGHEACGHGGNLAVGMRQSKIGYFLEEVFAEIVGQYFADEFEKSTISYEELLFISKYLFNATGTTIVDFANYGPQYIYEKAKEMGIGNAVKNLMQNGDVLQEKILYGEEVVESEDKEYLQKSSNKDGFTWQNIVIAFAYERSNELIDNGMNPVDAFWKAQQLLLAREEIPIGNGEAYTILSDYELDIISALKTVGSKIINENKDNKEFADDLKDIQAYIDILSVTAEKSSELVNKEGRAPEEVFEDLADAIDATIEKFNNEGMKMLASEIDPEAFMKLMAKNILYQYDDKANSENGVDYYYIYSVIYEGFYDHSERKEEAEQTVENNEQNKKLFEFAGEYDQYDLEDEEEEIVEEETEEEHDEEEYEEIR